MDGKDEQILKKDLTAAETAAIVRHQEALSKKAGREVDFDEAMKDFLAEWRHAWESEKLARDNAEQIKEIERHKWIESEKVGHDIGEKKAVEDWIRKHARIWRAERESLRRNGWEVLKVKVGIEKGLHMRPSSTLAAIAGRFNCQLYVHRENMDVYNFRMTGKGYLNVKSLMGLLTLGAIKGDELEFIATGLQAKEALAAVSEYVSITGGDEGGVTGQAGKQAV